MTTKGLTTLVVGYDDVEVAMADLADLAAVHEAHGVGEYEAAVVSIAEAEHEIVATTVDARVRGTVLGAGLGAVVAAVISPVLAAAVVGAGIGAVIGNIRDQIDAFKHTDMREIERLVDDSAANLIVIANGTTIDEIAKVATARGRRIVVPFSDADVDVLERELQRVMTMGGPQGV
jgi:uncharacterized membrane protein